MLGQLLKPSYNKPYFSSTAKSLYFGNGLQSIKCHRDLFSAHNIIRCFQAAASAACWELAAAAAAFFCTMMMMLCSVILKRFHPPPHGHGLHTRRESINFLPGCAKIFARRHFDACGKCRCPGSSSGYHPAPAYSADICRHSVRYMCGILNTEHLRACHS